MSTTHETPRDLRKKLSRANQSLQSLKEKYREKQYELKKINSCLFSMECSRDKWRSKCKDHMILTKNLKQDLCNIEQERDAFKDMASTNEVAEFKKKK